MEKKCNFYTEVDFLWEKIRYIFVFFSFYTWDWELLTKGMVKKTRGIGETFKQTMFLKTFKSFHYFFSPALNDSIKDLLHVASMWLWRYNFLDSRQVAHCCAIFFVVWVVKYMIYMINPVGQLTRRQASDRVFPSNGDVYQVQKGSDVLKWCVMKYDLPPYSTTNKL